MLVYLHITKAGGTTMLHYLERHCTTFHLKGWWSANWQAIPEETECLFSHCPYGVPDRYTKGTNEYMTFLRDPIDRMVSFYYFGLQTVRDPQHLGYALGNFINIMEGKLYSSTDNGMVRIIAGRADIGMSPPVSDVTEEDLEVAKKNLSTFAAVGTLETFDHDLAKFAKKFDWDSLKYEKYRVTKRPPLEKVDKKLTDLIRENMKYDQQLYDYAKEIKDGINE